MDISHSQTDKAMRATLLFSVSIVLLSCFLPLSSQAQALTAYEIIKKAEEKARGNSSYAEVRIDIVRPKWTRSMEAKIWSMGQDYSLILITAPAKDKGIVYLKRKHEIWNYVPSIERTMKLPPSMMSQSWMGTDFTNDDLVRESSLERDYTHRLTGEHTIGNRQCYRIELTPKPDAAVVWGKVVTFIDKEHFVQLRTEFYDEDDVLINVMLGKDVRPIGGRVLPTRLEMIPVEEEGKKTMLTYKQLRFDIDISESFFSLQNIRRVK